MTWRVIDIPPGRFGPFEESRYPIIAEMRAQGRFREAKRTIAEIRQIPEFRSPEEYILHYAPTNDWCARMKKQYLDNPEPVQ